MGLGELKFACFWLWYMFIVYSWEGRFLRNKLNTYMLLLIPKRPLKVIYIHWLTGPMLMDYLCPEFCPSSVFPFSTSLLSRLILFTVWINYTICVRFCCYQMIWGLRTRWISVTAPFVLREGLQARCLQPVSPKMTRDLEDRGPWDHLASDIYQRCDFGETELSLEFICKVLIFQCCILLGSICKIA